MAATRLWCNKELVAKGFVVDFSVHRSKDGRNPRAHVLYTLRRIDEHGFGLKPSTEGKSYGRGAVGKGAISDLDHWRESWAKTENDALEAAGSASRFDHRSPVEQGIDRLPEPKIRVSAINMQRLGKLLDPA